MRFTVWGNKAKEDDAQWAGCPVVQIAKAKVSEWNGRSLGQVGATRLAVMREGGATPVAPEAAELAAWWAAGGQNEATTSHSNGAGAGAGGFRAVPLAQRLGVSAIKDRNMGNNNADGKPEFLTSKVTITYINKEREPWYLSDPESKAKVTEQADGTFWCEKQGRSIEKPMRRYILSCQGSDTTGSTWLSAFDDQAKVLLGHTADELAEIKEADEHQYADILDQALWRQWNVNLSVKADEWNGEKRIKTTRPKSRILSRREQGTEVKLCPLRLNTTEGALKKEARFNSTANGPAARGEHAAEKAAQGRSRTAPKSWATRRQVRRRGGLLREGGARHINAEPSPVGTPLQ